MKKGGFKLSGEREHRCGCTPKYPCDVARRYMRSRNYAGLALHLERTWVPLLIAPRLRVVQSDAENDESANHEGQV